MGETDCNSPLVSSCPPARASVCLCWTDERHVQVPVRLSVHRQSLRSSHNNRLPHNVPLHVYRFSSKALYLDLPCCGLDTERYK